MELIVYAKEIAEQTNRAFDITIYTFMELWGFTTENYKVPSEQEISQILDHQIGTDKIVIDKETNTVQLKDDAEIDLGGIAKGYTSQKVAQIFEEYGVEHGVISLGGNVQAIGTKTDGSRWKVGIESPSDEIENMVGTYEAEDEAVITSGGYERYFEQDGVTYHHILDPKTGKPSDSDLISVTIVSKDGMRADCLSTTLFVLGKDKAVSYWKEHSEEFDCILVDEDNSIYVTEGIEDHFTSDHEYDLIKK
jgi:thiamine biosynthesis lipoprotein